MDVVFLLILTGLFAWWGFGVALRDETGNRQSTEDSTVD
jgi:hypothetical protein